MKRARKTSFSNKIRDRFGQLLLEVLFQVVKSKKQQAFTLIKNYTKSEINFEAETSLMSPIKIKNKRKGKSVY
jgi:hypothetical protein